jgi:hypothetical protein
LLIGIIHNATTTRSSMNGDVALAVTQLEFIPLSILYLKTVNHYSLINRVF